MMTVSGKKNRQKNIYGGAKLLNETDTGYRGIWYAIGGAGQRGPVKNKYRYKYSGGLGTYPVKHYPFSVYVKEVNKTFFCYGGAGGCSLLIKRATYLCFRE